MKLYNLLEEEVEHTVNTLLKDTDIVCKCEKCRLDIAAIALNNLPPKYIVTEQGGLFGRVNNLNQQFNTDLIKEVTKAIEIVGQVPQHGELQL